jgi:copper transport protein
MARRGLFLAVLASTFAFAFALAPDAGAHAVLARSEPADGSTLARPPHEVRLQFSEAISPRFRVVRVIDGGGRAVAGARVRAGGSRELIVSVPRLRRGPYQVTWEVLAENDGHVTGGALVFGLGARPLAARDGGGPGAAPAPLEASLRWLDLVLLVGLIGALAMAGLLGRVGRQARPASGTAERARRRLLAAAAAAAAGGALVGLVLLARQLDRLHATVAPGSSVGDVLGTRWGVLWLARELVLAALAGTSLRLRAGVAQAGAPLAGILVVALAVVRALAGHAPAGPQRGLAVAATAAHIVAAGAWIGGVAAFGVALAAARGEAGALARACRTTFARAAGLSLAVLAVTGLLAAGAQVATVDALLTTDYGRTLMTKSALVVVAVALGLANALALRRGALPRLLPLEASVGAGILLAAAVLTASPPAKGPEFAAPRPVVAPILARRSGDLLVTATARPNRPGANVLAVTAVSSRRPPPAPVAGVALRLAPAAGGAARTVALAPGGQGRFAAAADLGTSGRWRITALIRRGGRRLEVPFAWTVAREDPARPVVYSARALAPLLDRAAAAIVLVLAAAALTAAARRRPRRGPRRRARTLVEPLGKEAP